MDSTTAPSAPSGSDELWAAVRGAQRKIDDELRRVDIVNRVAARFGVSRLVCAGVMVAAILFFLFTGLGAAFIVDLVGIAYPAYASFKALETDDGRDDTQWLTYWVCFATLSLLENFSGIILRWIPFYYGAKCALLIYLFLPQTRGADFVYQQFVRPFFLKHSATFDRHIRQLSRGSVAIASHAGSAAVETVTQSALSTRAPEAQYLSDDEDSGEPKDPTAPKSGAAKKDE